MPVLKSNMCLGWDLSRTQSQIQAGPWLRSTRLHGAHRSRDAFFQSHRHLFDLQILEDLPNKNLLKVANELVHFGWKKEAIPFTKTKKSLIARFFSKIFE